MVLMVQKLGDGPPKAGWDEGCLGPSPACSPPTGDTRGISQGIAVEGQEERSCVLHLKDLELCPCILGI